jgi:DNA (cytosine-5)-methyltransferase 1
VFIAENVKGLTMGIAKDVLGSSQYNMFTSQDETILHSLIACGYKVRYKVLNAKYYNVPQSRERIIFIGLRNDYDLDITFPPKESDDIFLDEAFKGLNILEEDLKDTYISENTETYKLLLQMGEGESASKYHPKGHAFTLVRLSNKKVAGTVLASGSKCCSHIHPIEHRKLSIKELKRVMSFPDDYKLSGHYHKQWERLGRAVPPLMMKSVAEHVYKTLLKKIM